MKIETLTIQGFRGINENLTIELHNCLTCIFGKNSHGKTSISEALEWLLYGSTSKVDTALSKQEYSDSYRNCHYTDPNPPYVEAVFVDGGNKLVCRGELARNGSIQRYLNGTLVDEWPWEHGVILNPRPFIIQHALKSLLLAKPVDRYKGFTRLIGAEELNEFQENFVALCTKYKSHIPGKIQQFLNSFSGLEKDLARHSNLSHINILYKKKTPNLDDIYASVIEESQKHLLDPMVADDDMRPQLKAIRAKAIGGIFSQSVTLPAYSASEQQLIADDEKYFAVAIAGRFPNEYIELLKLSSIQHIITREEFIRLGLPFLESDSKQCPFCYQGLTGNQRVVIHREHKKLLEEINKQAIHKNQQERVKETLNDLFTRLKKYHERHQAKSKGFLKLDEAASLSTLKKLLPSTIYESLHQAIIDVNSSSVGLNRAYNNVIVTHKKIITSINSASQELAILTQLTDALTDYITIARKYADIINTHVQPTFYASKILKRELDKQAGTEEISVLIELLGRKNDLQKKSIIEAILGSLSELRSQVNEYVAEKLIDAVEKGLTSDVMKWYNLIKTTSDPDVHFAGFNLPKTQKGTTKARQIGVRASSYGTELASAISSLSESKLNALGLCINIANSLEGRSPFSFLIIDDPVQSLDTDHEAQITTIIRKLAEEEEKQIIIFSHERQWLRTARKACRTMNGYYYEIANYKISGPSIQMKPWATVEERRSEIVALINKPNASEIDRQHAAEEFRLLFNDLAANIWTTAMGKPEGNVAKYSNKKVREILIKCNMDRSQIDQIVAAYIDLETSHHQQAYTVSPSKLQKCLKLADFMKAFHDKLTADKKLSKATTKIEMVT